ncbi:MAG: hypothetical protein N838_10385 [Thiohalocapsa sp. PB-PSB1]|nr:MAG: hypothetical protein N838_10385 [Thiohalocapsa sp. PB-PSB1]
MSLDYRTVEAAGMMNDQSFRISDLYGLLLISAFGIMTAFLAMQFARIEYHTQLQKQISDDFSYHLPRSDKNLDRLWINPGARTVSQIYYQHRLELIRIIDRVEHSQTPYHAWIQSGARPSDVKSFFYLSLMGGDLASALQIMKDCPRSDDYLLENDWIYLLTKTFWQGATEYLHELDFGRAALYNSLYLSSSKAILGNRRSGALGYVEANRTLSHILQREIRSGRIKSLCSQPDVSSSFAALLPWIDGARRIPEETYQDLEARRRINFRFHCPQPPLSFVPYEEVFNESRTSCELWPLECSYKRLSAYLFDGKLDEIAEDVFDFCRNCTYLADDLLYWYVRELLLRESSTNQSFQTKLPISIIDRVAICSEKTKADYFYLLSETLETVTCEKFQWERLPRMSPTIRQIADRCAFSVYE